MSKVDPALIEKLLSLVWEEEDITPEVKQQCITLTEMLRYTKNMPDIFRSQISDLVRQSTVSRWELGLGTIYMIFLILNSCLN